MSKQPRVSHPIYGLLPTEIEGFDSLAELALNLRWSWNHATDEVWRQLDPKLWEITHTPWVVLQTVARDRIERVLADPVFRKNVDAPVQTRRHTLEAPAWFQQNHPQDFLTCVAYFSMEFMLSEALPIYSGGLGNVAGDQLKTASDLGVPVVGVGLLYQQGYFRQVIDKDGAQQAVYRYNDPGESSRLKRVGQMENKAKSEVNGFVYVAVAIAAVGGLLFGYDTGVISGAILFIKKQFSLSDTMVEIVVSSVLVGAVVGAAIGGALTGRFGRRKMIILAGIIFTASAIGTALAPTVSWLIAARVVSGIAIGIASFISPMYIAELVPAKVRGSLVAVNMLAITSGIVVAYLVDYAFSSSRGWRYMFGLAAIPSFVLIIGMWRLPDSPRWLISKSRVEQARQILQRARTVSDVNPEIADIQRSTKQQGPGGLKGLFQPSLKMPMIVGLGLAVFQQMTGINTVIYYAPTIFKFAGIEAAGPAILAGAGLTVVMWLFHVLAIFLLDRVGRRPLLLIGVAGQIVGLAILGAAFQLQQLASVKSYVAIGGLLMYVACFAFGLGPIFWLLISEIYPLKVRGAAMSAVTVTNWALNLVVAVTFLTLVGVLGHAGTFWLYGVIAIGAWVFFYLLVPETKGKTLEQIEEDWQAGKQSRHHAPVIDKRHKDEGVVREAS